MPDSQQIVCQRVASGQHGSYVRLCYSRCTVQPTPRSPGLLPSKKPAYPDTHACLVPGPVEPGAYPIDTDDLEDILQPAKDLGIVVIFIDIEDQPDIDNFRFSCLLQATSEFYLSSIHYVKKNQIFFLFYTRSSFLN